MKSGFTVTGDKQIELNLAQLSRGMAGTAVVASMRKGMTVLRKGAAGRYRVIRDPATPAGQHVDENLTVARLKGNTSLDPKFEMGVRAGTRAVHLPHLIENGTAPHWQPNLGIMHPGARPNPVMHNTFNAEGPKAVDVVLNDLAVQFDRQVRKLRARALTR